MLISLTSFKANIVKNCRVVIPTSQSLHKIALEVHVIGTSARHKTLQMEKHGFQTFKLNNCNLHFLVQGHYSEIALL